jgi:hypothetical protein
VTLVNTREEIVAQRFLLSVSKMEMEMGSASPVLGRMWGYKVFMARGIDSALLDRRTADTNLQNLALSPVVENASVFVVPLPISQADLALVRKRASVVVVLSPEMYFPIASIRIA